MKFTIVTQENLKEVKDFLDFSLRGKSVDHISGWEYQANPHQFLDSEEVGKFQEKLPDNVCSNYFHKIEQGANFLRLCSPYYEMDYDHHCMDYKNVVVQVGDTIEVIGNLMILTDNNNPLSNEKIGNSFDAFISDKNF